MSVFPDLLGRTHGLAIVKSKACGLQSLIRDLKKHMYSCLQTEESSQTTISANKLVHLARCATQGLCNTDTSDVNNTQSRSLPSLNF